MSLLNRKTGFPQSLRRLINELSKLPSVGEKSATRLAYHLVTAKDDFGLRLSSAITDAVAKVGLCQRCGHLAEGELCEICEDPAREDTILCVVEKPVDVIAVEKSGGFFGRYHVLHALWSPMRGIRPQDTGIVELVARIKTSHEGQEAKPISELILATGSTVEGDATALFIANEVSTLGVEVTRLAQGMPMGGELEYADEMTLTHAFRDRRRM